MRLRPGIAQHILDTAACIPTQAELAHAAVAVFCQWWGVAAKGMCERMVEKNEGLGKKDGP